MITSIIHDLKSLEIEAFQALLNFLQAEIDDMKKQKPKKVPQHVPLRVNNVCLSIGLDAKCSNCQCPVINHTPKDDDSMQCNTILRTFMDTTYFCPCRALAFNLEQHVEGIA